MTRREPLGFAVANTAEELAALLSLGYTPDSPIAAPVDEGAQATSSFGGPDVSGAAPQSVDQARALLDAKGIKYDKRWGLAKLVEALNA